MSSKPTFKSFYEKTLALLEADVDGLTEIFTHRGPEAQLTISEARKVHGHARSVAALENASKQKDAHGYDCKCSACEAAVMTVEKALNERIRTRDRGYS